jgi:hypothetical protein
VGEGSETGNAKSCQRERVDNKLGSVCCAYDVKVASLASEASARLTVEGFPLSAVKSEVDSLRWLGAPKWWLGSK